MNSEMNIYQERIRELIENHKEELLDSHLKYGGVYLSCLEESSSEDGQLYNELCVELDEGTIAFSLFVFKGCPECGSMKFKVSLDSSLIECSGCSKEFDSFPVVELESVIEMFKSELMFNGIGVYTNYSDFESAIYESQKKE